MRIAKVIGSVTLSRCHPAMAGSRLRCVLPVDDIAQIDSDDFSGSELLVTWDELGAGNGDLILQRGDPRPYRPPIA